MRKSLHRYAQRAFITVALAATGAIQLWANPGDVVFSERRSLIFKKMQIVRGCDLLSSTPRQIYLQRLLGLPTPEYYHVPLLVAPDGRRLSKREHDLDMGALRERCTPEALLGCLAQLSGLRPTAEPVTAGELAACFSWNFAAKENITMGNPEKKSEWVCNLQKDMI